MGNLIEGLYDTLLLEPYDEELEQELKQLYPELF
jgi:hypothetical protein